MKRVAIQGFEGCFHHIAAEGFFGTQIEIVPCATFRALATALEQGDADVAVMAIENSIAGSILPNYSILQNRVFRVVGEIYLHIKQNLLVLPGIKLEQIEEVQSHPMALLQCTNYLDNKHWRLIETEDTALSAKYIADKGLKNAAAVAGELAARLYGLEILVPEINTIKDNHTRFMILERAQEPMVDVMEPDKASLFFQISHRHGSLVSVLKQMEWYDLNMTKLQSYPIPSDPWNYIFHLDMEFDNMEKYRAAISDMSRFCDSLRIYGEYSRGMHI